MAFRQRTPPMPYKVIGRLFGRTDLACRLHVNHLNRRGKTGAKISTSPEYRRLSAYENWKALRAYVPPPPVSKDETIAAAEVLRKLSLASTATKTPSSERSSRMDIKNLVN